LGSLPIGALGLAVLLLVRETSGGFGAGGLVVGLLGLGTAVGMAAQGRLIDLFGQPRVLVAVVIVQSSALVGLVLAAHAELPVVVLGLLALLAGAAEPQVGASLRALWADLVSEAQRPVATALSSLLFEGSVLLGPLLLVALLAVTGPGAALLICAACFAVGTLCIASSPPARAWRSAARRRNLMGALISSGIRTTTIVAAAQGLLTGLVQVPAAAAAARAGLPDAGGVLYAALSAGSLVGTAVYGARRWTGSVARRLAVLLLAVTAVVVLCAPAPTLLALGVALLFVGVALGPVAVTYFALVDQLAPEGAVVEAFTITTGAALAAQAAGTATAGLLIDRIGSAGTFLVGAAVAALTAAAVVLRRRTLPT
jgi:predicted MFS family arabinose efflux permease